MHFRSALSLHRIETCHFDGKIPRIQSDPRNGLNRLEERILILFLLLRGGGDEANTVGENRRSDRLPRARRHHDGGAVFDSRRGDERLVGLDHDGAAGQGEADPGLQSLGRHCCDLYFRPLLNGALRGAGRLRWYDDISILSSLLYRLPIGCESVTRR